MHRRVGVAVVCAVAAALVLPAAASALTKTVYAGPPPSNRALAKKLLGGKTVRTVGKLNPDINDFFLHTATINAGDTIRFVFTGFHTVDFPAKGSGDLPLIVPGATVTGVTDAAGNPFWFNGHVPSLGVNPALLGPTGGGTYDGSKRVDTGIPLGSGQPKPFKLTFTKPGTYKYFCDIHPGMIGYVVVKAKGRPVPSARQDAVALTAQQTIDILSVKRLLKTRVPADQVSLGVSNSLGVELYSMFPAALTVNKGTVVTFFMSKASRDTHTASFGPNAYLMSLSNALLMSPGPTQVSFYPSGPTQPIPLNSTSHGNGFANTGALDQDPTTPNPPSGRIQFTQAGTYHFICIIHPFMQGTIVVK